MNMRRVALEVDTASAYGRGLLRGIAEYARAHGPWTFVRGGAAADGILALVRSRRQARSLVRTGVPFVDLDYALPELSRTWGVAHDEAAVAELAARHLLDCGLRDFAFVGLEEDTFWERERRESFLRRVPATVFPGGSLPRWLASLPRPCGILAANDERGRDVLEAARRAGLRVPENVAVLGVDDDEVICELAQPALSSIALDTRRIGYEGAALLDRRMRGRRAPRRLLRAGPLGVISRRSTDVLALDDALVARAVRFLRAHAAEPIGVDELVRATGAARRTLEVRFRRALGRTPYQEILRVRLARVAELLVRTDWPLKKVALSSGFTYPEQMHAAFRRAYGTTPTRYRRRLD
jgi:LacI family transcriptional regulator